MESLENNPPSRVPETLLLMISFSSDTAARSWAQDVPSCQEYGKEITVQKILRLLPLLHISIGEVLTTTAKNMHARFRQLVGHFNPALQVEPSTVACADFACEKHAPYSCDLKLRVCGLGREFWDG